LPDAPHDADSQKKKRKPLTHHSARISKPGTEKRALRENHRRGREDALEKEEQRTPLLVEVRRKKSSPQRRKKNQSRPLGEKRPTRRKRSLISFGLKKMKESKTTTHPIDGLKRNRRRHLYFQPELKEKNANSQDSLDESLRTTAQRKNA